MQTAAMHSLMQCPACMPYGSSLNGGCPRPPARPPRSQCTCSLQRTPCNAHPDAAHTLTACLMLPGICCNNWWVCRRWVEVQHRPPDPRLLHQRVLPRGAAGDFVACKGQAGPQLPLLAALAPSHLLVPCRSCVHTSTLSELVTLCVACRRCRGTPSLAIM